MRNITLIAGRGKRGDQNWGADFSQPDEVKQKWLKELQKHIGEVVMLTGGGSLNGDYWLGVLKGCDMKECGGKQVVHAFLENVTPEFYSDQGGKFSPCIDSWQISIFTDR